MIRLAWFVPWVATVVGVHVFSNAWVAILLYHAAAVLVLRFAGMPKGNIAKAWPRALRVVVVVAAAGAGITLYLLWNVARVPGLELADVMATLGLSGTSWWLFALYFVTVHPLIEELFWRRYLASRAAPPAPADIFFGGYHAVVLIVFLQIPFAILAALVTAMAGWAWRHMSFRQALTSHIVGDLSVILAAVLLGVR